VVTLKRVLNRTFERMGLDGPGLDGRRRLVLGAALAGTFAGYSAVADRLPEMPLWADTALTALVLMPAAFALIWLALPLRRRQELLALTAALAVLGALWYAVDLDVAANLAKLGAAALAGWCFLIIFEQLSWVVVVACIIPVVDGLSVWRGPTREIVGDRPEVFGALSVTFPSPGGGAFQLGLPDVIFFALFLGATVRWRLRPGLTWLALTASLGVTIALAVAFDPFGIGGLPALPGLSFAFLLANGDLLLHRRRGDTALLMEVSIRAGDPETVARFYRDAFGTRAEPSDGVAHVWTSWALEGPDGAEELGLEVDDVGGAYRRALEAGAQAIDDPADEPWGATARIRDPAGHVVVLRQTDD
jgi:predicted enzyme related to lactoylglutathione lyase